MRGIDARTGKPLSGLAHLRQSIRDILTTPLGSRIMRRNYGSRLFDLVDNPLNEQTLVEIFAATAEALIQWEPRLKVMRVQARRSTIPPQEKVQTTATLLVDPVGDDNNVLFTAVAPGAGGNLISVRYAEPLSGQDTTTIAVAGSAITVTPGTKARMIVSGALTAGVNGEYFYAGIINGKPHYTQDGINYFYAILANQAVSVIRYESPNWCVWRFAANGTKIFESTVISVESHPDGQSYYTTIGTGTPTVTAAISSAAEIIAAVNASPAAAALVTASAVGIVTGAVAEVAAANLAGGGEVDGISGGNASSDSSTGSILIDLEAIYLPTGQPVFLDGIVIK